MTKPTDNTHGLKKKKKKEEEEEENKKKEATTVSNLTGTDGTTSARKQEPSRQQQQQLASHEHNSPSKIVATRPSPKRRQKDEDDPMWVLSLLSLSSSSSLQRQRRFHVLFIRLWNACVGLSAFLDLAAVVAQFLVPPLASKPDDVLPVWWKRPLWRLFRKTNSLLGKSNRKTVQEEEDDNDDDDDNNDESSSLWIIKWMMDETKYKIWQPLLQNLIHWSTMFSLIFSLLWFLDAYHAAQSQRQKAIQQMYDQQDQQHFLLLEQQKQQEETKHHNVVVQPIRQPQAKTTTTTVSSTSTTNATSVSGTNSQDKMVNNKNNNNTTTTTTTTTTIDPVAETSLQDKMVNNNNTTTTRKTTTTINPVRSFVLRLCLQLVLLPVGFYFFLYTILATMRNTTSSLGQELLDQVQEQDWKDDHDQNNNNHDDDNNNDKDIPIWTVHSTISLGFAMLQWLFMVVSQHVSHHAKAGLNTSTKHVGRYLRSYVFRNPFRSVRYASQALRILRWIKYLGPLIGTLNKLKGSLQQLYQRYQSHRQAQQAFKIRQQLWKTLSDEGLQEYCAKLIQRVYRGRLVRNHVRILQLFKGNSQALAALRLQALCRGFLARIRAKLKAAQLELQTLTERQQQVYSYARSRKKHDTLSSSPPRTETRAPTISDPHKDGNHPNHTTSTTTMTNSGTLTVQERRRMYQLRNDLKDKAQDLLNVKLLLRPNTTFVVTWKTLFVVAVLCEIVQLVGKPIILRNMKEQQNKSKRQRQHSQQPLSSYYSLYQSHSHSHTVKQQQERLRHRYDLQTEQPAEWKDTKKSHHHHRRHHHDQLWEEWIAFHLLPTPVGELPACQKEVEEEEDRDRFLPFSKRLFGFVRNNTGSNRNGSDPALEKQGDDETTRIYQNNNKKTKQTKNTVTKSTMNALKFIKEKETTTSMPWYCHDRVAIVQSLYGTILRFCIYHVSYVIGMIYFLDVFVAFFTGTFNAQTGSLEPSPWITRWIIPGLGLQLLVNPHVRETSKMIQRGLQFCIRQDPVRIVRWTVAFLYPAGCMIGILIRRWWLRYVHRQNEKKTNNQHLNLRIN